MRSKKKGTLTVDVKELKAIQKKYGLTDPAMIQKRIIFVNLMALLKQVVDDTPGNRAMLQRYNDEWYIAEQARKDMAP